MLTPKFGVNFAQSVDTKKGVTETLYFLQWYICRLAIGLMTANLL